MITLLLLKEEEKSLNIILFPLQIHKDERERERVGRWESSFVSPRHERHCPDE